MPLRIKVQDRGSEMRLTLHWDLTPLGELTVQAEHWPDVYHALTQNDQRYEFTEPVINQEV